MWKAFGILTQSLRMLVRSFSVAKSSEAQRWMIMRRHSHHTKQVAPGVIPNSEYFSRLLPPQARQGTLGHVPLPLLRSVLVRVFVNRGRSSGLVTEVYVTGEVNSRVPHCFGEVVRASQE